MPQPILVSACLLGLNTRFDGACKENPAVLAYLRQNDWLPIPVCPEQLAGLPTPRSRTFFRQGDGRAILNQTGRLAAEDGSDLSHAFVRGAQEALKTALITGCRKALLKERSPSCGVHQVYLGETVVAGQGVAAALLAQNGILLFSEEDLPVRADGPLA